MSGWERVWWVTAGCWFIRESGVIQIVVRAWIKRRRRRRDGAA